MFSYKIECVPEKKRNCNSVKFFAIILVCFVRCTWMEICASLLSVELWALRWTSNERRGVYLSIHALIKHIYDYDSKKLRWISVLFFSGTHCTFSLWQPFEWPLNILQKDVLCSKKIWKQDITLQVIVGSQLVVINIQYTY